MGWITDNIKKKVGGADTAVITVGQGKKKHAYAITNFDGEIFVFDTLARKKVIDSVTDEKINAPGVRHYDDWTPSYENPTEAFVAYLKYENDELTPLFEPLPDENRTIALGPITGSPDNPEPEPGQPQHPPTSQADTGTTEVPGADPQTPVVGAEQTPGPKREPERARTEFATDPVGVANAHTAVGQLLGADGDIAAATALVDALLRTAESPGTISLKHGGTGPTRWVRVEVTDQSRTLPARDKPDKHTGLVTPTESGQVTELLDKSWQWGATLHKNGERTRWFELAARDGRARSSAEPALTMTFKKGQVAPGVSTARNGVADFLRQTARLDEKKIEAARLAVSEFLGNAGLHAKEGGAELTVEVYDDRVRITVADKSRGLPVWRPESNVDAADEVAPSAVVDQADVDLLLAGMNLDALESGGMDPSVLGERADGEHGRGNVLVMADAIKIGVDLAPNGRPGKKVWVEYRTPKGLSGFTGRLTRQRSGTRNPRRRQPRRDNTVYKEGNAGRGIPHLPYTSR